MGEVSTILILSAVRIEAAAIGKVLRLDRQSSRQWTRHGLRLELMGIGARLLPAISAEGISGVIAAGIAGGLSPELGIGDVVVDELSAPLPRVPGQVGKIHTSRQLAATPEEKAHVFRQTGALAVEMENTAVREWAAKFKIAYCGIRGISDTAQQSLDPAMVSLVDEVGGVRTGKLATFLLANPGKIPTLHRLGTDAKAAAVAAAETVKAVLAGGWPDAQS